MDNIYDLIERRLVYYATSVIHHGLTHTYEESEDSLPSLRGRILLAKEIRNPIHNRITCRFSELTVETDENMLLKSSLHHLQNRHPEIRRLLARMEEVPLRDLPRGAWPRIRYTRLNRGYKRSLDLSRLAIRGPSKRIVLERHGRP